MQKNHARRKFAATHIHTRECVIYIYICIYIYLYAAVVAVRATNAARASAAREKRGSSSFATGPCAHTRSGLTSGSSSYSSQGLSSFSQVSQSVAVSRVRCTNIRTQHTSRARAHLLQVSYTYIFSSRSRCALIKDNIADR